MFSGLLLLPLRLHSFARLLLSFHSCRARLPQHGWMASRSLVQFQGMCSSSSIWLDGQPLAGVISRYVFILVRCRSLIFSLSCFMTKYVPQNLYLAPPISMNPSLFLENGKRNKDGFNDSLRWVYLLSFRFS